MTTFDKAKKKKNSNNCQKNWIKKVTSIQRFFKNTWITAWKLKWKNKNLYKVTNRHWYFNYNLDRIFTIKAGNHLTKISFKIQRNFN